MKYPKISIVTVSFNQAKYLEDNIKSVIAQKYPNVEHIIIDGGSTDGSVEILKKYDKHIKWISEKDEGQSDGLNKGFKMATGDIIGWVNSDDRLTEGSLFKVAEFFMNNPHEIAVVGDQDVIDENGNLISTIKSREYTYDFLVNEATGITQNSMFFKREVFDKIGYLDKNLHYAMDMDLFIRIASLKKIPYIPQRLAQFRIQPESKTSEGGHKFAKELLKLRKKYNRKFLSPAHINDLYVLYSAPLKKIPGLRKLVRKLKGVE